MHGLFLNWIEVLTYRLISRAWPTIAGCSFAIALLVVQTGAAQPTAAQPLALDPAPPAFTQSSPPGQLLQNSNLTDNPGGVSVQDELWFDSQRQREVPVRIYKPQLQSNDRLPLIIVSHGLGGSRMGYSYLGRHFAANGYIAVHLQHEGSDRSIWSANPFKMLNNLAGATQESHAIDRARDVSFAIDQLLSSPQWQSRIDPQRIGMAGHSYGANTALLVSGAQVAREQGALVLRDSRVRAATIISAPPFHGEGEMRSILGKINVPTLHVTGTLDDIRVPGYRSNIDDRIAVFEATSALVSGTPKHLIVFTGATHSIFTDRIDRAGLELNTTVKAATKQVALAFFDIQFKERPREELIQWFEANRRALAQSSKL
jgi:dienelactone hydrolase